MIMVTISVVQVKQFEDTGLSAVDQSIFGQPLRFTSVMNIRGASENISNVSPPAPGNVAGSGMGFFFFATVS